MARHDDAAELDKRVTFQRFVGDADIVGDVHYLDDSNWQDVMTLWTQIRTIGSREFYAAGQEENEVTHNLKIRYRSWDYNAVCMRATWNGKVFRLLSPPLDLDGDRRYQLLKAAEVWR
ncbi:MAG: phage head closure protein [Eubacteriales bacterium]|nr:phage head closure protein [Eubacteriales bacterium]